MTSGGTGHWSGQMDISKVFTHTTGGWSYVLPLESRCKIKHLEPTACMASHMAQVAEYIEVDGCISPTFYLHHRHPCSRFRVTRNLLFYKAQT